MNKWKWISFGVVGSLFAVSHLGMIGYIATREKSKLPTTPIDIHFILFILRQVLF